LARKLLLRTYGNIWEIQRKVLPRSTFIIPSHLYSPDPYRHGHKSEVALTENRLRREEKSAMKWTKERLVANLHLLRIHLLIFKLFVIKELPCRMIKVFR